MLQEKCVKINFIHHDDEFQLINFLLIYRNNGVERRFNESKKLTNMIWDDVSSQIKHEVFGMKYNSDPKTKKQAVKEPIKSKFSKIIL